MSETSQRQLGTSDSPIEDALEDAFARMVDEGTQRLHRSWREVLVTGFFGGTEVAMGVLAYLSVVHATGGPLLGGLAFSIGFLALLLVRSELFTEERARATAELQQKYEAEKKERELEARTLQLVAQRNARNFFIALSALGLAGTRAAGLKASFGTDGKPLHAGWASLIGLTAAIWAGQGMVGHPGILEAGGGFGPAHGRSFDLAGAFAASGRPADVSIGSDISARSWT